jgi:hypothetical protein
MRSDPELSASLPQVSSIMVLAGRLSRGGVADRASLEWAWETIGWPLAREYDTETLEDPSRSFPRNAYSAFRIAARYRALLCATGALTSGLSRPL